MNTFALQEKLFLLNRCMPSLYQTTLTGEKNLQISFYVMYNLYTLFHDVL